MSKTLLHVLAVLATLNMASHVHAEGMPPAMMDGAAAAPAAPATDDTEGAPSDDIDAPPPAPKPVAPTPAPEPPPPPKKVTRLPALVLPPIGAKVSRPDAKFLNATAENQIAGMYDAQLASDKGSTATVKNLALRMYDDHTEINNQIQQISAAYGLRVATDPNINSRMWFKRLSRLDGDKFDSTYIDATIDDIRSAIDDYKKESTDGGDEDIRRFATNVLNLLQEDLKIVQSVHDGAPYPPAAAPAAPAAPATPSATAPTTPAAPSGATPAPPTPAGAAPATPAAP